MRLKFDAGLSSSDTVTWNAHFEAPKRGLRLFEATLVCHVLLSSVKVNSIPLKDN